MGALIDGSTILSKDLFLFETLQSCGWTMFDTDLLDMAVYVWILETTGSATTWTLNTPIECVYLSSLQAIDGERPTYSGHLYNQRESTGRNCLFGYRGINKAIATASP